MKIDLEKFICSLGRQCYCSLFNTITFRDIQRALADQGLEYMDGAIVEIESQDLKKVEQEVPPEEYNRGYKQAIDDAVEYMDRIWGLNIFGNTINDFRETMEQNLKEK